MNKNEVRQILEDIEQIKNFRKTLKRWKDTAHENGENAYLVTLGEIDQRLEHIQEDLEQTDNNKFLIAQMLQGEIEHRMEESEINKMQSKLHELTHESVSYTHLTLPTNREV